MRGGGGERETSSAAGSVARQERGHRAAGHIALTMVSCWDTGVLLCALLGGLLLTGETRPRWGVGGTP